MEYKYSNDPIENELFDKTHLLMDDYERFLKKDKGIYNLNVHQQLQTVYIPNVWGLKRKILLPMPRDKWYPQEKCLELEGLMSHLGNIWPKMSHYQYAMECMTNDFPSFMFYSGYAVCGNELIPCSFFVNFLFTLEIEGIENQKFPEEWVIDPMGIASGKNPECYIGVNPKQEHIENFLLGNHSNPLEGWAAEIDDILREDRELEREINCGHQKIISSLRPDRQDSYVKLLNFL